MSKSWRHRPPAAFRLDRGHAIIGKTGEARSPSGYPVQIKQDAEFEPLAITMDDTARSSRRGVRWGVLFWMTLCSPLLLVMGLAITTLITDLFARNQELGWIGLALAILAAVSLIIIGVREIFGLMRLVTVENLRERAAKMIVSDDRVEARALVRELLHLTQRMPRLARRPRQSRRPPC